MQTMQIERSKERDREAEGRRMMRNNDKDLDGQMKRRHVNALMGEEEGSEELAPHGEAATEVEHSR